jgi:hypothetical protein
MVQVDPSTAPSYGAIEVDDPLQDSGTGGAYSEVRVHGIGDHGLLSAQGSGTLLDQTPEQVAAGISISAPPAAPTHQVRYLNWSRTSRSKVRALWYVAFPYTLLNTAAFMCPRAGRGQPLHRIFVVFWGAVLTAATVLWVVAASEAVLRYAANGRGNAWVSAVVPLILGSLVPLVIAVRVVKHRGERRVAAGWDIPAAALWVNLIVAVGTVAAVAIRTPARGTVPPRGEGTAAPCLIGPDGTDCVVYQGDWVTIAAFGTVALAVVALLVLAVASLASRDTTWQEREATPLLGTGIALLAATVSLHVGWSSFLIAIQGVLGYLDGWYFLPFMNRSGGTHPANGLLLPFDAGSSVPGETQAAYVYGPHLVAIVLIAPMVFALLLAAVYLAGKAVGGWIRRLRALPTPPASGRSGARRVHGLITATSGAKLTSILGVVLLSWAAWLVLVRGFLSDPPSRDEPSGLIAFFIGMQHLLLVAFLLLVLVRSLRKPLAIVGDLVGFWNISAHPLAALPYRNVVVTAIKNEIAGSGRVALVGHSQGSVLCFTALLERARDAASTGPEHVSAPANDRVDLVTCGSPLASLYSRYFPRFFGADEFEMVNASACSWRNFWRDTDPIATPVGARGGDEELTDPPEGRPLRRHGDYWIADEQRTWIEARAAVASSSTPA